MSDARLRELERRWRETGTFENEVAYLRERQRAGALSETQLKFAAHCSSQSACTVLDMPLPRRTNGERINNALKAFACDEAYIRAGIAGCVATLQLWERKTKPEIVLAEAPLKSIVQHRIAATIGLVVYPCEKYRSKTEALLAEAMPHFGPAVTEMVRSAISASDILLHLVLRPHARRMGLSNNAPAIESNLHGVLIHCKYTHAVTAPVTRVAASLAAWALGNDPLPALLARLESEAGA